MASVARSLGFSGDTSAYFAGGSKPVVVCSNHGATLPERKEREQKNT